jgi:hypothetical protein
LANGAAGSDELVKELARPAMTRWLCGYDEETHQLVSNHTRRRRLDLA